jgi:hypothetical protein
MRLVSLASAKKYFIDTFNRSNQTLNAATDGTLWNIIRGTWSVLSNKAYSSTAASSYPLASVKMVSPNATISLKGVSQGSTAALWVTDSNQWWGIGIDQTAVSTSTLNPTERAITGCTCQTCANTATVANWNYVAATYNYAVNAYNYQCNVASYPVANYNYNCNVYNNGFCNNISQYPMVGPGQYTYTCNVTNNRYCNNAMYPIGNYSYMCNSASYPAVYAYAPGTAASYPEGNYNVVTYYECNCQTCYPQYVRFIQSISGTVTTLTSWIVSTVVNSIKVTTSGSGTTTKIYSDTNLVTQIGSDLTYTPTGVTVTPQYGIMVKPSSYLQGNTIEEITIEVN